MDKLKLDKTYIKELKKIKKERAKKKKELIENGINKNHALNQAQYYVNQIYGKGWSQRLEYLDSHINQDYYKEKYKYQNYKTEGIESRNKFEKYF